MQRDDGKSVRTSYASFSRAATMLAWLLAAAGGCREIPEGPLHSGDITVSSALTVSSSVNRVIPVRFIQFYVPGHPEQKIPKATLQTRLDEANVTYAKAGVQFVMRSNPTYKSSATFANASGSYTWPTTPADAELVQDLGCDVSVYGTTANGGPAPGTLLASLPPSRTEPLVNPDPSAPPNGIRVAFMRAGAYCAPDGEIVAYILESWEQGSDVGADPGHANSIVFSKTICQSTPDGCIKAGSNLGPNTFNHELGHYLGLSHTQDPGSFSAEFWDLVYGAGTPTTFFNNQTEAANYVGPLALIDPGSASTSIRYCTVAPSCSPSKPTEVCGCPPSANCPANGSTPRNDTGDLRREIAGNTYYSGDSALKGLGTISGTKHLVNAMAYNDWCYRYNNLINLANFKDFISDSQAARVRKTLTENRDLTTFEGNSNFPGAWGRRNRLGFGAGFWTEWTLSSAYVESRPGVDISPATPGHAYVTWKGTPPFTGGVVVAADCTTTQTGGCTAEGVGVGSHTYQGPSDITLAGTGSGIRTHVIAWESPGGYPLLRDRLTSGGSWNPASDWLRYADGFLNALSITGRANGQIDAVGRGLNSIAYIGTFNADGSWPPGTSWQSLEHTISGPVGSGTRFSDGMTIDVVARDGGNIVHRSRNASGTWTSWTTLFSGTSVSEPALNEREDGEVDVIAVVDNNVCFKTFAWGSWWDGGCVPKSGSILGDPALSIVGIPSFAAWESGRADIVAKASDGSIVYRYVNKQTGAWWPGPTEWARIGGAAASQAMGDPVIVATGVDTFMILYVDASGNLYRRVRYQ
jgi:hypothetical protein